MWINDTIDFIKFLKCVYLIECEFLWSSSSSWSIIKNTNFREKRHFWWCFCESTVQPIFMKFGGCFYITHPKLTAKIAIFPNHWIFIAGTSKSIFEKRVHSHFQSFKLYILTLLLSYFYFERRISSIYCPSIYCHLCICNNSGPDDICQLIL